MKSPKLLLRFLNPYKNKIILFFFLDLVVIGFDVPIPYITKLIFDNAIPQKSLSLLISLIAAILIVKIIGGSIHAYNEFLSEKLSIIISTDIKKQSLSRFQTIEPSKLHGYYSGDIINRLDGVEGALLQLVGVIHTLLLNGLKVIVFLSILLYVHPLLSIISLLVLPFDVGLTKRGARYLREKVPCIKDIEGITQSYLQNSVHNSSAVKALGAQSFLQRKFSRYIDRVAHLHIQKEKFLYVVGYIQLLIQAIGGALFSYFGWKYVINGRMSLGDFIAISTYVGFIYGPLKSLTNVLQEKENIRINSARFFEIYSLGSDEYNVPKKNIFTNKKIDSESNPMVSVENLSFSYNNNGKIFDGISLTFCLNGLTIIKGKSGIGKTTFLHLIAGLYKPQEGSIILANNKELYDIKECSVGYLFQNPLVLPGTIFENVSLTEEKTASSIQKVEKALTQSECLFVQEFSQGINTNIGDGGITLSRGQIQRLMLARLFFMNPDILLLDEPLTGLDKTQRNTMFSVIKNYARSRPIIMVTHDEDCMPAAHTTLEFIDRGKISVTVGNFL